MKVICNKANHFCIKIEKPCAHATLHNVMGTTYTCMEETTCTLRGEKVKCIEVNMEGEMYGKA